MAESGWTLHTGKGSQQLPPEALARIQAVGAACSKAPPVLLLAPGCPLGQVVEAVALLREAEPWGASKPVVLTLQVGAVTPSQLLDSMSVPPASTPISSLPTADSRGVFGELQVTGRLPPEVVVRILRAQQQSFRRCLQGGAPAKSSAFRQDHPKLHHRSGGSGLKTAKC